MDHLEPARHVAGPTLTVVTAAPGPTADLTERRRARTRLSIVLPDLRGGGGDAVEALTASSPAQFDTQVVVVPPPGDADPHGDALADATARLDHLGWSWTAVPPSAGGRAGALDGATAVATGDFLVLPRRPEALAAVPAGLGHLWVHGADALVVSGGDGPAAGPGDRVAVAHRLAEALGLRVATGAPPPALAVLRRWVARFLLEDLGRAVDALDELVERVGMLELRLLEVVDPSA